jgi:hypothetical protein
MFRIDAPTAVASRPAPAAAGTPGWFTGGDPTIPQAATTVTADWANMIQAEAEAVVIDGGLTPSKTTFTQLRDAIRAMISAAITAVGSTYALAARTITGSGLATGGGDLSGNRTITVPKASASDVTAGTDDSKAVTPLALASTVVRVARSITATGLATGGGTLAADRTIDVPGATAAEVIAGAAGDKAVTPAALRGAETLSAAAPGYYKFPNGLIVQWGQVRGTYAEGQHTISFPTPFPSACFNIQVTNYSIDGGTADDTWAARYTNDLNGFQWLVACPSSGNQSGGCDWLAWGK